MRHKIRNILLAGCLSALVLSGCSGGGGASSSTSGSGTSTSSTSSSSGESGYYYGDPDREISVIKNVPCNAYSDETLTALHNMYLKYKRNDTHFEEMVEYMLALRVGDELAAYFAKWASDAYDVCSEGFCGHPEALGEKGENFINIIYGGLTVIKSFDTSALDAVFDTLIRSHTGQPIVDIHEYNYTQYGGNDEYYPYKKLSERKEEIGNGALNLYLNEYKQFLDGYHYTEEDWARYNEYTLQQNTGFAESYELLFSFIATHADKIKEIALRDLKVITDGFVPFIQDYLKIINKLNSTGAQMMYGYASLDRSDLIKLLLEHRTLLVQALRTILASEDFDQLFYQCVVELWAPQMRIIHNRNGDEISVAKIDELLTKLKNVNAQQLKVGLQFLFNVIDSIPNDVYESLYNHLANAGKVTLFEFVKGFYQDGATVLDCFENVYRKTSLGDKTAINNFFQTFGIDASAELNKFKEIYITADISTEEGENAFIYELTKWLRNILDQLESNFGALLGGRVSKGSDYMPDCISGNNYNIYFTNDSEYEEGGSFDPHIDVRFHLYINQTNGESFGFSGVVGDFPSIRDSYVSYLIGDNTDGRFTEGILLLQSMSLFVTSFTTFPSSGYGRFNIDYDLSFTANDKEYTLSSKEVVYVSPLHGLPLNLAYVPKIYGEYRNFGFSLLSQGYDAGENFDTLATGWHVVILEEKIYVYYVYIPGEVTTELYNQSIGIILKGASEFYRTPYNGYRVCLKGEIITYFETAMSFSAVSDFTTGYHEVDYEDSTFRYVVVDETNIVQTYTSFDLTMATATYGTFDSITIAISIWNTFAYRDEYDSMYTFETYVDTKDVDITNVSFDGSVLTFTYEEETYCFHVYYPVAE